MLKKIQPILAESGVIFAYLFGSRATEKANENSDFDLAIYLKEKDKKERFETKLLLSSRLASILKKDVDVVILNDIQNNFLLFDILQEGKVIFDQDEDLRFYFENTQRHQVIDFLTHLKYVDQERANFAKN